MFSLIFFPVLLLLTWKSHCCIQVAIVKWVICRRRKRGGHTFWTKERTKCSANIFKWMCMLCCAEQFSYPLQFCTLLLLSLLYSFIWLFSSKSLSFFRFAFRVIATPLFTIHICLTRSLDAGAADVILFYILTEKHKRGKVSYFSTY